MSLRRRFVLALGAFALTIAAGFGYLSWRISRDALAAELDRRLVSIAGAVNAVQGVPGDLALSLASPRYDSTALPYHNRLKALKDQGWVADAYVFDGRGTREMGYRALVTAQPFDSIPIGTPLRDFEIYRDEINRALLGAGQPVRTAEGEGRTLAPATTEPFRGLDGRLYEYGFIRLDDTPAVLAVLIPADFFSPLAALGRSFLLGSLVALVLAVALGGLLAANIVQPLERLSRAALRIQRGHMDRTVEVERGDELGRLSRAMERMRKGILERDEQLRLMLAQVAHEIRNPLGGLELFASAAADTADPGERARLMDRVRGEVEALNRIINDFLTFARPLQTDRHGTDLRDPILAAAELAERELEREGCALELDLADEPLMAVADADQVKRAVLNLIHNAAQVADRVRLSTLRKATEIVVTVTDDGPGVPKEMRERIFEPFITDKQKGAGLGLAIVRKVAEAHGGRVEVAEASDPAFGQGAEFSIYFIGLEEPPTRASPGILEAAASGSAGSGSAG